MNILQVVTTIDFGGAEVQLLALVQQQIKEGHSVSVIPLKGGSELGDKFINIGAEVDLSIVNKNPIAQLFMLKKLLKKRRFEIVHAHLPRAQLISAFAKNINDILIVSRHDAMPFFVNAPSWLSIFLWRCVQSKSQKIISISSAIRIKMIERQELKAATEAVVIYYGISNSHASLSSRRHDFLQNHQNEVQVKPFVFGTIARLVDEKNIQALIRAFAIVRAECLECTLIVVGYGPLEANLRQLAQSLGISEYVSFTGKQDNVGNFLSKMDTFVLPSKTEGFGLVLLEAMSANLPIIASRVDAIPEVLGDNCGLFFDPSDIKELARLMILTTNFNLNKSMRKASANRVKLFSILESEKRIRKVYEEALKERK